MSRRIQQVAYASGLLFLLINYPIWPQLGGLFRAGHLIYPTAYVFIGWLMAIVLLGRLSRILAHTPQNTNDDPLASDR